MAVFRRSLFGGKWDGTELKQLKFSLLEGSHAFHISDFMVAESSVEFRKVT